MNPESGQHRAILIQIADRALLDAGLLPDFSPDAMKELAAIGGPASSSGDGLRDLTARLWCSIDNDDSLDLDQLTVAESLDADKIKVLVAVADVDSLVHDGSAINDHAQHNTTSIYTAAKMYPMIPERLSTGLTSLNFGEDRLSVVIEMVIGADGTLLTSDVYRAKVRNKAKLAYNSVAAWLTGSGPMPGGISAVAGLADNLRLQDVAAQRLHDFRHVHGALSLDTIEARPVFDGDQLTALEVDEQNRAKHIIEDFMVAANGVTARYLAAKQFGSLRRVVRVPKRWDRIVELASQYGFQLPSQPDSRALEEFLVKQQAADPLRFPDLSLSVIKLLGSGEYVADPPGQEAPGHFGLAVNDYAHSTAPNRRFPDLITQRLVKAALAGASSPYDMDALYTLATHCTEVEDVVTKLERRVAKSAAAILLEHRIGETFDAIVTGAADKGTWVRLIDLPVEGKLVRGFEGVDVGDRLRVQLVQTNVQMGFIDFARVASGGTSGGSSRQSSGR